MIRAAIFDMDGLLIDSEPLWERVNYDVYKKLGVEITEERRLGMMGRRTIENTEELYRQHRWEGPSPQEVEVTLREEIIKLVRKKGALMPGVHHALAVCKKAGLRVAIASSSTADIIDAVVDTLEIREHFEHIYSAQFEKYGKPHPGVFLKVAEHFKIPPGECLVFEDSPAGVLAAKAAGMACVAVPATEAREHAFVRTADAVISSLEEFDEDLLARLGGGA